MTDTTAPQPPPPPPATVQEPKKNGGRNCWVIGCSGCLIIILLFMLVGWFISWRIQKNMLDEPFEPVELSEPDQQAAERKLQALELSEETANNDGQLNLPPEGLELTEDEVNYLISQQDGELADTLRLDFEPGEITAEFRADMENGRYLKLSGTIEIEQTGDLPEIRIVDLRMAGFSLPKSFLKELANEDIGKDIFEDPEARENYRNNIEKIEVRKDSILIVPKAK